MKIRLADGDPGCRPIFYTTPDGRRWTEFLGGPKRELEVPAGTALTAEDRAPVRVRGRSL